MKTPLADSLASRVAFILDAAASPCSADAVLERLQASGADTPRTRLHSALDVLRSRGWAEMRNDPAQTRWEITPRGAEGVRRLLDGTPAPSAGFLREPIALVYDVPEERASVRKALRRALHRAGFLYQSRSVWIGAAAQEPWLRRLLAALNLVEHADILPCRPTAAVRTCSRRRGPWPACVCLPLMAPERAEAVARRQAPRRGGPPAREGHAPSAS